MSGIMWKILILPRIDPTVRVGSLVLTCSKPLYAVSIMVQNSNRANAMSWKDIVAIIVIILGIVLFLYGSNYYDASIGWIGVGLIVVGIVAEVILEIYSALRKR